jgi:transcriptional regulator with XRE-family HTH domain
LSDFPLADFSLKTLSSPTYQQFTLMLKDARIHADLTQDDVAARLKRPQSFVSKYESGERRLDVVEYLQVCAVLGISPHDIIAALADT